jgi:phosphoadenosine phosphosulfate reductase
MEVIRHRLDGDIDMVQRAIDRIKCFEPYALQMHPNGYYVAYSGGKDSAVIAELCRMAGVKFELVNNHTTVDPPELVYHTRKEFERYREIGIPCSVNMPKETMWRLIVRKATPPSRTMRYCCAVLKEGSGKDRFVVTGVRWAESVARKSRSGVLHLGKKDENGRYIYTNDNDEAQRMMRTCTTQNMRVLNPIIDWTDEEVWEFIKKLGVPHCSLYDEGFKRLGCVGCPMAGSMRIVEFNRWPTYKRSYLRAFGKMLDERKRRGLVTTQWKTPEDVFAWWMEETTTVKQIDGQIDLFDELQS